MMPGTRSAPVATALQPSPGQQRKAAADPNAPVVQDSMQPGYQRETNFVDETKRKLDPRRHNPVKNTKKKIAVGTPSSRDLKSKFKDIF